MSGKGIGIGNQLFYNSLQVADHFFTRDKVNKAMGKARMKLNERILEKLREGEIPNPVPVERRNNLAPSEFREKYLKKGIPVIFDGAAAQWTCCREWNLDYFDDRHGHEDVILLDRSGRNTNLLENPYESTTFHDVIENIRSGGNKYLNFYPILTRHPEHYHDFDTGWLKERRHQRTLFLSCELFLGGAGTESTLHNANQSNLFVQVFGEKKWILYPVGQTPLIDPDPVRNLYRNTPYRTGPPFNSFEPDYEQYPAFRYLKSYEVHLRPGDVLYNPPYMWHSVKNVTDSIGCSYRWINFFHSFAHAPLCFLLDLCATNPPFMRSLKLSAENFNLVRLAEEGLLEEYLRTNQAKKTGEAAIKTLVT